MSTGFTITGARELQAKLDTLARNVQKRVVRKAVRAARKPVLARAKANALARVGGSMGALLAKAIVIAAPKKQQPGTYALHVQLLSQGRDQRRKNAIGVAGFVHESQRTGRRTYIPAAIEYGHGASKEQAARPFMRPAADSTERESLRILGRELASGLLREAIKGRHTR